MDKQFKIPKIEPKVEVRNEAGDIAELYLYGEIRESYWWEEDDENIISSKRVRKALDEIKVKTVKVHINSAGGDVFESIAIGNILKQFDGEVHIIIDGLAGSGASIVAMAGDTIQMFPNSMMMIHKAWTFTWGNADELRKIADDLDKIDSSVLASYKGRFIGTEEELKELIKDETWLTADECEVFGFCDKILDSKETKEEDKDIKVSLLEKYRVQTEKQMEKNLFNKFRRNE